MWIFFYWGTSCRVFIVYESKGFELRTKKVIWSWNMHRDFKAESTDKKTSSGIKVKRDEISLNFHRFLGRLDFRQFKFFEKYRGIAGYLNSPWLPAILIVRFGLWFILKYKLNYVSFVCSSIFGGLILYWMSNLVITTGKQHCHAQSPLSLRIIHSLSEKRWRVLNSSRILLTIVQTNTWI